MINVLTDGEAALMAEMSPRRYSSTLGLYPVPVRTLGLSSSSSSTASASVLATKRRKRHKSDELDDMNGHDQSAMTLDGTGIIAPALETRKPRMKLPKGQSPKGSKTDEQKLVKLREILSRDGVLKTKGYDWDAVDFSFSANFRQLIEAIFSPVWEPLILKDCGQVQRYQHAYHCTP